MLPSQSLLSSEDSFVNVNLCETFIFEQIFTCCLEGRMCIVIFICCLLPL